MTKLIAYIRGGIGDTWIAISALQKIIEDNKLNKFDVLVFTDSVYYFRDYPMEMEQYSLDMIRKLTPNVIEVSPWINDGFWLSKRGIRFDDTTDELSQEEANKYMNDFLFWRPNQLKEFISETINSCFKTDNVIFVDCIFTECIMMWNFIDSKYERISNDRATFKFIPYGLELNMLNQIDENYNKNILIHVRKKEEGDAYTETSEFYQKIINWCYEKDIFPVLIGVDNIKYSGKYIDLRGSHVLTFEGMGYLINNCKVMVGNDSGFSTIKLYQQQKDKLLIMNHNRFERSKWVKHMFDKSNCLLLDAKEDNFDKITKSIEEYYETK